MNNFSTFRKFFCVFCAILLIVMLIPWGSLPKAQDDAQLISEAIAEAIANHEADPTAHLGDGESLEQHKTNEIIDHPQASIVADKLSNASSFFYTSVLPPLDGAEDNCSVEIFSPFLGLYQNTGFSGEGTYNFMEIDPFASGYVDGDIIVDFVVSLLAGSGTGQGTWYFGFGKLEIKDGYFRIGYYTTSWQYSSWIAVTESDILRFRFFYSAIDGNLYVMLRDNQVFSVAYSPAFEGDNMMVYGIVNRGTSTATTFIFGAYKFYLEGM